MSKDQGKKKAVLKQQKAPAKKERKIKSTELTNAELEQVSGGVATQDLTALKYIGANSPPTSEQVLRINTVLKIKPRNKPASISFTRNWHLVPRSVSVMTDKISVSCLMPIRNL